MLVLALAGCVFGMTACGSTEDSDNGLSYTQEEIEYNASTVFTALDRTVEAIMISMIRTSTINTVPIPSRVFNAAFSIFSPNV